MLMIDLRLGDCLDVMRTMPDRSVHCCVTSPPYFGLRDYGAEGQIGLEATPDAFVAKMVAVFAEVRRVLRDDGTLWLNLGDSYATQSPIRVRNQVGYGSRPKDHPLTPKPSEIGAKHKDLLGIPWRVAFALQADGWYLRSDIIWHKPNPMPESVRDRPTKSHEYLFLLSKSERYHYDADAVREPFQTDPRENYPRRAHIVGRGDQESSRSSLGQPQRDKSGGFPPRGDGRNRRSVWTVATRPFKGAHFATFPPKLIEPCILAGTSEAGCCPACGKPWERVVEKVGKVISGNPRGANAAFCAERAVNGSAIYRNVTEDRGFSPACSCGAGPAVPCTVLDPFNGAGTTGVVAKQHRRRYIGIDLNPEYLALSDARIEAA